MADLQTLLSYFLNDLYAGTLGVTLPMTSVTVTNTALATTSTDGGVLTNTTVSTAAVPVQISPRLRFRSNVWNTTATAANNTNDWWIESVPASGTTPSGLLKFGSSLNGAAATYPMTLSSAGAMTLAGTLGFSSDGGADIGVVGSSRPNNIYAKILLDVNNGTVVLNSSAQLKLVATAAYIHWGTGSGDNFLKRNGSGDLFLGTTAGAVDGGLTLGVLKTAGANGQAATITKNTVQSSAMSGATLTLTALIPAGSLVVGVTVHPTTTITSGDGGTTYSVGDGSDVDRWGATIAFASDVTLANATITSAPIYAAATNVVLTCDGGKTFNAGVVRATVHYLTLTAATS